MTDERKRPRIPLPTTQDDPEVVTVDESETPATERVPLPMPPPARLSNRPPTLVGIKRQDRAASQPPVPPWGELAAAQAASQQQLSVMSAQLTASLATQRKHAQQIDGLGRIINARFDVFHEELSMLRATVVGDHAPRLGKVEGDVEEVKQLSAPERAKALAKTAGVFTAHGAAYTSLALVVAKLVAQGMVAKWPETAPLFEHFGLTP